MIAMLSSVGLPGTHGFVGEFLVLLGSFQTLPGMTTIAALSVVLSAVYLLWAVQRVLFNPLDKPENRNLPDMNWREVAMMAPVAIMIFYLGVHPAPVLRRMEPRLQEVLTQVEARRTALTAPTVSVEAR
jgi:NADH-quinone oxidoreductase subunit M